MGLSATDRWLHAIPTARYADARNLTVSTSSNDPLARPASYGYYLHDAAAIWVRGHPEGHRARADMAATFAHELAHAVTHDACAGMPRDVRDVVAESVAYAVCSRFGLDLSLRSDDYVAGWLDDPEAFRVGMAAIHDGAASPIDAIEAAMTGGGELDLLAAACRTGRRGRAAGVLVPTPAVAGTPNQRASPLQSNRDLASAMCGACMPPGATSCHPPSHRGNRGPGASRRAGG